MSERKDSRFGLFRAVSGISSFLVLEPLRLSSQDGRFGKTAQFPFNPVCSRRSVRKEATLSRGGILQAQTFHLCPFQGAECAPYITKYCAHNRGHIGRCVCFVHECWANLGSEAAIKSLI